MKKNGYSKGIGLSLMATMLLGSSAYAGKIIGIDAGTPWEDNVTNPPQQYGFGGWNLENVNVKMVLVDDMTTVIGDFNTTDGTYTQMELGDTFESEIYNITDYNATSGNTVGTTVMAHLHGKDWPVGEPAGIKIVNVQGEPVNCIMTTSYIVTPEKPTLQTSQLFYTTNITTI